MSKKLLTLLYRSFDEELTAAERLQLERALANSQELRAEKERIIQLRSDIANTRATAFRPFFVQRVMHRIQAEQKPADVPVTFFESLLCIFRPVAIAAAILILVMMSYNLLSSDRVSLANAFGKPALALEQMLDPTLSLTME